MSKFFNLSNRTLHSVESYSGAVKFAQLGVNTIKVKKEFPDNDEAPMSPKLRRQNADEFAPRKIFFSTENQLVITGNYDVRHETNTDLVEVDVTVTHS